MSKRKSIAIFISIFSAILISNSSVFALMTLDDEASRSTLKGLKGVYVHVYFFQEKINNLKQTGLSEEGIRTDVELKLRMAGIKVVSKEDIFKISGGAQLVVGIIGLTTADSEDKETPKQITSSISVELVQSTFLTRAPEISALAVTWSQGGYVYGLTNKDMSNKIRSILKDCVDRFINAYLSVNPKGGK
jgi:hypothetical protein